MITGDKEMNLSLLSIVILVVCIVVANLILAGLRYVIDLPWLDSVESAIASGIGALAWALIVPRMKR